ncbi:MAG: hypothetical protein WCA31_01575 [Acidimicrobiales bacterium]
MTFLRSPSLRACAIVLSSSALVLGVPLAAQAAVKNPTTKTVLAAAKAALANESGVHVKVTTISGKVDSSVVADIGKTSGSETYVSGDETFTITVTPTYAYLSGSKSGLTTLMGLTAAEQSKVGTDSISMKKGSTPYSTFQTNLTSGAFSGLLPPAKGTTLLAKRDSATNGYQLSWTEAATTSTPKSTSIMTISSGTKALPLKESVKTSSSKSKTTFSKWGEDVKVEVPTSTIAYSKIF